MPEIALLTNPTAGKGKGAKARAVALPRLRDAGFVVRDLQGADAGRGPRRWPGSASPTASSRWSCAAGDGMVHLAAQALAGTPTRLGVIPAGTGNDVARYLDIPRKDPAAAADVVVAGRTRTLDLARSGSTYFVTVLAAGFDAIVNERANQMTWPRGQMRYNLATLAELRTFKPLALHPRARRGDPAGRGDAGRRRQRARPSAAACGSPRGPCSTTVCSTWSSSRR